MKTRKRLSLIARSPGRRPTARVRVTASRLSVRRVVGPPTVQPKLSVGPANDAYEREADRMADQVMRMPVPESGGPDGPSHLCSDCAAELAEERVQRMCPECEEEMQRQPVPEEEEEEELQTSRDGGGPAAVEPAVADRIEALRGGGQPLPASARAFFEPRFGHDFDKVRVHTSEPAAEAAKAVKARAFTLGSDIVFGRGEYSPHQDKGRRLLAHELTHTLQQGGAD